MGGIPNKLKALFEGSDVLVAAYDGFDRLRFANKAFRAAFFVDEHEEPLWSDLMRRNHLAGRGTVIRHNDFEAWLSNTTARRGKTGFRAFETDLVDGRWLWMTESVSSDGWMLCVASEITSLSAKNREVRQERDFALKAAYTDELTGTANRRFTMARVGEMLQREAMPSGTLGCLAIIDLDHFKRINDRFGHHTGDLVLRDFVNRFQGHLRRSDCFGRLGGEEFGLVMPATPIEQAELILERMLVIIRQAQPLSERPDLTYTFSAGIAAAHPGDTITDLYARSDNALYFAKKAGRNQIHLDGTPLTPASASSA
nr:sensor domain-containing diguanylate cyclase [Acuticoccus kandeliae]